MHNPSIDQSPAVAACPAIYKSFLQAACLDWTKGDGRVGFHLAIRPEAAPMSGSMRHLKGLLCGDHGVADALECNAGTKQTFAAGL